MQLLLPLALGTMSLVVRASKVPVLSLFENDPVERGPFKLGTEHCLFRPKTFPTKTQTSISLCVRFSLFYMVPKGSGITMIGSWDSPLIFELRDYPQYPYTIFRFRWNLRKDRDKRLEQGQYWYYWFTPHITLSLLQWYNLCLSYNSDTNDMISVLDGHVIAEFNNKDFEEAPTVINEFGFNCVYGSPPNLYGIRASFADIQIADHALKVEEMEKVTTCLEQFKGNVFHWSSDSVLVPKNGTVSTTPTWSQKEFKAFCQDETFLVLFDRYSLDQLDFDKALSFCRSLGGEMAMPSSLEEEQGKWMDMFASHTPRYSFWREIFLPVTNQHNGTWINVITGDEPTYTNWDPREPNGGVAENCSALTICDPKECDYKADWSDYPCSNQMGYVCAILNNIRLELLGLCKQSVIDKEFTGIGLVNERRAFRGKYDFRLEWNAEDQYWVLQSPETSSFAFHNQSKEYPLGVKEWVVVNDTCWDPGMYRVNLSLASCFGSQFACTDGTCQPLDNRCNQRKDCPDGSDELDCSLLKLDSATYIKDYLPPSQNQNEPLRIQLVVDILRFLAIEETDFLTSIQFQLHMKWRDSRVSFTHLTDQVEKNMLTEKEKFSIWTPYVVFHNTKDKFTSSPSPKTTIIIEKQNEYVLSPSSQTWKSKMYLGEENDIHYYDIYSINFQCDFALNNYPFDSQICFMIFTLPTRVEDQLLIELTSVNNYGDTQLAQYDVADYHIMKANKSNDANLPPNIPKSGQIIKIIFKRRFIYQLFTVYLPTFCLLIIMQSTHYFPNQHFEARVMVSLTGMLVMTTLLLSVSNNLPPTNYINLIDVWMLFAMVTPFFDIIIHTFKAHSLEQIRLIQEKEATSNKRNVGEAWRDAAGSPKNLRRRIHLGELFGKRVVPFMMLTFFILYAVYVCIVY